MRVIFRFLVFLTITIIFVGCGLFKNIQYIPVESKIDSVYIERIVRDTVTVTIPGDSIAVVAQDSSHLENRYSISDAVVDSTGRLHHSLINKSIKIEKEIVYKEIEKIVEKEVPVVKEIEKEVKVIPGYYKTINIVFWSMMLGVLLFLLVKFKVF